MTGGPVVIDLSPAQSPEYAERGIARHAVEFARAIVARHPDLISQLLIDPHRPPLARIEEWATQGAIPFDCWRPRRNEILHLISPFELDQPLRRLWPRAATEAGTRLIVTVHDVIPEVMPEDYLADPGLRRRWRARRPLVQAADRVFTLSRSASADVVEHLGIAPERIALIGAGCSSRFVPPDDRLGTQAMLRREVPGLGRRFVVYNGGTDPRKNLDRLLVAWAMVAPPLRQARQLVVACRMAPASLHHYRLRAEELGVASSVVWAGQVSDAVLVGLYQNTELMVFPSLYEGYGLPVVEALACGAPVIVAATSCLVELVAPEATFDPRNPVAMAVAITRGLSDEVYRFRLLAAARQPPPTWAAAADRAAAVYRQVAEGQARRAALRPGPPLQAVLPPRAVSPPRLAAPGAVQSWRRMKLGVIVAPVASPWAQADSELARALAATSAEVDCFGDDGRAAPLSTLPAASSLRVGYDAVVLSLGGHPGHLHALAWLCDPRNGAVATTVVVVARELSLAGLYGAGPPGFLEAAWRTHYPAAPLSPPDVDNALMVRGAVSGSGLYLVASPRAAAEVAAELPPDLVGRVLVAEGDETDRARLIISWLDARRQLAAVASAGGGERRQVSVDHHAHEPVE